LWKNNRKSSFAVGREKELSVSVTVRVDSWDVRNRLAELGLDPEPLVEVVQRGHIAFVSCTANHPPMYPGLAAWAETVRALREYLIPKGWTRSDENIYSLVIDKTGGVAIAVATGDDGTGRQEVTPTTKAAKGPSTLDAVVANQFQLSLFTEPQLISAPSGAPKADEQPLTWILLIHRARNEVRSELSLPSSMGPDGHIDRWEERIILGAIPLDPDFLEVVPPTLPGIEIEIKRRA
jgi:hypothetical protein